MEREKTGMLNWSWRYQCELMIFSTHTQKKYVDVNMCMYNCVFIYIYSLAVCAESSGLGAVTAH